MPSPFDNLSRMLTTEKQRGYDNKAVIGGLERLPGTWAVEAVTQVDSVEERLLIEEMAGLLHRYPTLEVAERATLIEEMLAKIVPLAAGARPAQETPAPPPQPAVQAAPGPDRPAAPVAPPPPPPQRTRGRENVISYLDAPVTRLPGIKRGFSERLSRLNIEKIGDFLTLYPRRYLDYRTLKTINQLEFGEDVTILGTVWDCHAREIRKNLTVINCTLSDQTATIQATWFNQPWLTSRLKPGSHVVISGKVDEYLGRLVFQSPEWEPVDKKQIHTGRLVPIYPLTEGIHQKWLRTIVEQVVDYWKQRLPDHLTEARREELGLLPLGEATQQIHFPNSWEDLEAARRRLAFDELLFIQLGVLRQRRQWRSLPGKAVSIDQELLDGFLSSLPFELTGDQRQALQAILDDMAQPIPMNRLLQGDVGSGKTIVALAAMLVTAANGAQSVIMAPTEILAEQHYRSITRLVNAFQEKYPDNRFSIHLLTGSTPAAQRKVIYDDIVSGQAGLVIGTHALIQENVEFNDLRLVIIDEQHRFGVQQRTSLREKGYNPHVLVMSATPIPRSLALTLYGDLDLSIIKQMPPGRQPITTRWLSSLERERAYSFIRSQIEQGRQAFIICPLVEESENIEAKSAVEEHARLQKEVFPDLSLGLVHGRMKGEEKDAVMHQFHSGDLDILVSTAVVEVGIDVPNATVMLVEGANRFGLAQLHQFRGRVGRGEYPSTCLLLADSTTPEAEARLSVITQTSDGFELAEEDLKLRGPGEFFGTRQSGLPDIQLARLSDVNLLETARSQAKEMFDQDPELTHPDNQLVAQKVNKFWQAKTDPS